MPRSGCGASSLSPKPRFFGKEGELEEQLLEEVVNALAILGRTV
jgi:hypothetical protein